jgi:hypothetical protein
MDLDVMMRQLRGVIAFITKYEPFLEELMRREGEHPVTARRPAGAIDDTADRADAMAAGNANGPVSRSIENQPVADRSESKTVGPLDGAPIGSAPVDKGETKVATSANVSPAGAGKE